MRRTLRTFALLALIVAPASAQVFLPQFGGPFVPVLAANLGSCVAGRENGLYMVSNAASSSVCTGTGTAASLCVCDGSSWRAIGGALAPTATLASTVTVADAAGDTTTFPLLAGSATGSLPPLTDPGLAYNALTDTLTVGTISSASVPQAPIRSIRVDAELTAVAGKVYNTVAAALTYVSTQSPSDAEPWRVDIYGATFVETEDVALTIPDGVHLKCHNGGNTYFGGDATTIRANFYSGTWITMQGGSISNCILMVNDTATGSRVALKMTGSASLDHVGVITNPSANNAISDVTIECTPPSSFISCSLYYVNIVSNYDNANSVGVLVGTGGIASYDNGVIADGSYTHGKGVQVTGNSPARIDMKNVAVGSLYNSSAWTVDLSNEGTGAINVSDVRYKTSTGTITGHDFARIPISATAPSVCDATHDAPQYRDTTGNDLCTCFGAAGYLPADGTGTCA